MRRIASVLVLAAAPVFGQPGGTPTPPPAGSAPTPAPAQPATPAQPAAPGQLEAPKPAAVPVPDGPVVERKELEGGIIVEDIVVGTGLEVLPGTAVVAYYHGTLKEGGAIFDSAFDRGEPIAFALERVIPGWQQGVPGMKVGGVRRLTIPAALAYGERSPSPLIPANSDLVFVIQLVDTVAFEDIKEGEGETADKAFVPVTRHTIKSEGAEVAKTGDSLYCWLPGEVGPASGGFDAMQVAINGMKVGGKRRVHIPAMMNMTPPVLETERPQNVPLDIEIELVAVRNLPQR